MSEIFDIKNLLVAMESRKGAGSVEEMLTDLLTLFSQLGVTSSPTSPTSSFSEEDISALKSEGERFYYEYEREAYSRDNSSKENNVSDDAGTDKDSASENSMRIDPSKTSHRTYYNSIMLILSIRLIFIANITTTPLDQTQTPPGRKSSSSSKSKSKSKAKSSEDTTPSRFLLNLRQDSGSKLKVHELRMIYEICGNGARVLSTCSPALSLSVTSLANDAVDLIVSHHPHNISSMKMTNSMYITMSLYCTLASRLVAEVTTDDGDDDDDDSKKGKKQRATDLLFRNISRVSSFHSNYCGCQDHPTISPAFARLLYKIGTELQGEDSIKVLRLMLLVTDGVLAPEAKSSLVFDPNSDLDPLFLPLSSSSNNSTANAMAQNEVTDLQASSLSNIVLNEMSTISCEAFFLIAHYYASFSGKEAYVSRAEKCLDQINRYIVDRRRREEEIFDKFPNEELQRKSISNELKETAKVLYARTIIAHNRGDPSTTSKLISGLICSEAAKNHEEIFRLCLLASRAIHSTYLCSDEFFAALSSSESPNHVLAPAITAATSTTTVVPAYSDPFITMERVFANDSQKLFEITADKITCALYSMQLFLHDKIKPASSSPLSATVATKKKLGQSAQFAPLLAQVNNSDEENARSFRFLLTKYKDKSKTLQQRHLSKNFELLRNVAAKAISLYKIYGIYDRCQDWCTLLLSLLNQSQDGPQCTADLAEATSSLAYAMTMSVSDTSTSSSSSLNSAMQNAKEAVRLKPKDPIAIAIWFLCSIRGERNGLVHIDRVLKELSDIISTAIAQNIDDHALLKSFSMMARSCHDNYSSSNSIVDSGTIFKLEILSKWIKTLAKPGGTCKYVTKSWKAHVRNSKDLMSCSYGMIPAHESPANANANANANSSPSLLTLLKAFLLRFELFVSSTDVDETMLSKYTKVALEMLEVPIRLFKKMRERSSRTSFSDDAMTDEVGAKDLVQDAEDDDILFVWDDVLTTRLLGQSRDCVWVCEQCWNLALLTKKEQSFSANMDASAFFAFAHDYLLMSCEEEGKGLTNGFLDSENKNRSTISDLVKHNFVCSEVSSEFSAQCLLMSTSALLDSLNLEDSCALGRERSFVTDESFDGGSVFSSTKAISGTAAAVLPSNTATVGTTPSSNTMPTSIVDQMKTTSLSRLALWRIGMSKAEFEGNEIKDPSLQQFAEFVTFRCILELKDDGQGMKFLEKSSTVKSLSEYFLRREKVNKLNPLTDEAELKYEPDKIFLLYNFANIAENSNMLSTARVLYRINAFLCEKRANGRAVIPSEKVKLATLLAKCQKKRIFISSSVKDCVGIFESVAETCITENNELEYNACEIGWFCVDAYNRGVNLMYLGDTKNSEILLASALNMLPKCGEDVKFHATIIREAYAKSCEIAAMHKKSQRKNSELVGSQLFSGICPTK